MKVITKNVWIGERENEGMKVFSFLFKFSKHFSVTFIVRAVQSNRKIAQSSVSVSTHNQSVARLDDASPRRVAIF